MFLTELLFSEKIAFFELASLIASIDGNLSIKEDLILEEYRREMDLEDYTIEDMDLEDILHEFKSERSKNIALVEILHLIFSDGVFHDQERESVQLIKKYFGFNPNQYESFKDWIGSIKELSK
ncbi:MAG TPA: hypothetical protein VJ824_03550 [Bacillota bacterium]|nr:hypothetical protein [Bacillota bacterium]